MTEDDLETAQDMLAKMVQQINEIEKATQELKQVAVKYQEFVVQKMVGKL